MRARGWWLLLGTLALPPQVPAQAVKVADLVGGWQGKLETIGYNGTSPGWMILWPDGLWWYTGPELKPDHGGARWRLVGDTLWLANDFLPYFDTIMLRNASLSRKYGAIGIIDTAIIKETESERMHRIPDSVYWSEAFRDRCKMQEAMKDPSPEKGGGGCGVRAYKVSVREGHLHLVQLENLSWHPEEAAMKAVFQRDSLVGCFTFLGSGKHRDHKKSPC